MQSSSITAASWQAMQVRYQSILLTGAWLGKPHNVSFAQGAINALKCVREANGAEFAAIADASEGGYQPPAHLQAALAALPVDIERLSLKAVQQFLTAQGVELANEHIAERQGGVIEQLKGSEVPRVDLHDEHRTAGAELNNGSGGHEALPAGEMETLVAPIVAMLRGAA